MKLTPIIPTPTDTGWREVSDLLINGWTASRFRIRRVNDQVLWKVTNLNGVNATNRAFLRRKV